MVDELVGVLHDTREPQAISSSLGPMPLLMAFLFIFLTAVMVDIGTTIDSKLCGWACKCLWGIILQISIYLQIHEIFPMKIPALQYVGLSIQTASVELAMNLRTCIHYIHTAYKNKIVFPETSSNVLSSLDHNAFMNTRLHMYVRIYTVR